MQLINIGSGVVASSSLIKSTVKNKEVGEALDSTRQYEAWIGIVMLVFGLMALVERLGIVYFGLSLGSSFPQALPAIMTGLVLGAPMLEKYAFLKPAIAFLTPYRPWLGLLAIACGLGSLLFGCVLPPIPFICRAPFGV